MLSRTPCQEWTQQTSKNSTNHHHHQQHKQEVSILPHNPAGLSPRLLLVLVLLLTMRGPLVQHRRPGWRPTTRLPLGCQQQQVPTLQHNPVGPSLWLLLVPVLLLQMRAHLVQPRQPGRRPTTRLPLGCQQQQVPTLQHTPAGPSPRLLLVPVLLLMRGPLVQHRRPRQPPTTQPTLGWWHLPPSSFPLCRGYVSTLNFRRG
jgi:hypothetical protein